MPSTLVPSPIWEYAKTHYPEDVITKLSKKPYGYKIELSNDEDMRFTPQGQFIEKID
ncbi:MAG: PepSY-like domain-containing protein [Prevotella sp.]|nr:PepSY-like domain-containing protein [Prevotella sp.]